MDNQIRKVYIHTYIKLDIERLNRQFNGVTFTYEYDESCDGIVCFELPNFVEISKIKWIHSTGAGVDKILGKNDLIPNQTIITRTIEKLPEKIFDYIKMVLLMDKYQMEKIINNQKNHYWEKLHYNHKNTVLIFGTGSIGSYIGKHLKMSGYNVLGISKSGNTIDEFHKIYTNYRQIIEDNVDVIINCLPLTSETINYINQDIFHYFKPSIYINVGRGGTQNEDDLMMCLRDGTIGKAYCDVFNQEPLNKDHSMWSIPNLTITPHIAAITDTDDLMFSVIKNLTYILENKDNPSQVIRKRGY